MADSGVGSAYIFKKCNNHSPKNSLFLMILQNA